MPATIYAPDTDLRLLSVPLTMGDGHQLDFATAAAQTAYFQGKTVRTYADFSYQRKDHYIAVPEVYDNLLTCNYIMYRNTAHGSKWFYAFIERVEFVNQNCSHIYIKTDVFQTWLFDFAFLPSLVRRECVADDSLWKHTLPEPVPTGDTVSADEVELTTNVGTGALSIRCDSATRFDVNYYVAIMCNHPFTYISTTLPSGTKTAYTGGAACGCVIYGVSFAQLQPFLEKVNDAGDTGDIVAVFPVPRMGVGFTPITHTLPPPDTSQVAWNNDVGFLFDGTMSDRTVAKNNSSIDGYTPKNKKLFCYPYNFMLLRCGDSSQVLKYELFGNPSSVTTTFHRTLSLGSPPVFGVSIGNYEGITNNVEKGVSIQNWAPISWSYDLFKQYLALHSNSLAFSALQTITGIGMSAATGGLTAAADAFSGVLPRMMQYADMAKQPEGRRGQLAGNYLGYANKNGIYVEKRTIRAEYAHIVDDYFSRYGYRVDTLKTPSFKNRPKWDYLLTENCAISGDIPASDATELQGLFNSGITVWHDSSHFGDYSQNNAPT
jgi:hypothetical protein